MASMEEHVSQAIHAARTLEKALHDPGPWSMVYGEVIAPAVRMIAPDRIIFRAHFPDACVLNRPDEPVMYLRCGEEILSARLIEEPCDGEFITEWILLTAPESARV